MKDNRLQLDLIGLAGALNREGNGLKALCEKVLDLSADRTRGGLRTVDVIVCRAILGQVKEEQDRLAKLMQWCESSLENLEQKTGGGRDGVTPGADP
jgi:hypothetical protein